MDSDYDATQELSEGGQLLGSQARLIRLVGLGLLWAGATQAQREASPVLGPEGEPILAEVLAMPSWWGCEGIALSADGTRYAVMIRDRGLRIWNLETRTEIPFSLDITEPPRGAAFSPDGAKFAIAMPDGRVDVWNVLDSKVVRRLATQDRGLRAIALSADGALLATASGTTVRLWDLASGTVQRQLEVAEQGVAAVAFSPDGKRLATGSWEEPTRIWDLTATTEPLTLVGGGSS